MDKKTTMGSVRLIKTKLFAASIYETLLALEVAFELAVLDRLFVSKTDCRGTCRNGLEGETGGSKSVGEF